MTIRDILIKLGFDIDETSRQEAEQGINGLKNFASKALGAIGIGLSIAGITSAITDCVALSSEVEEMQNKFDVVFQGMTDEVEEWAQSYADAIGRNKNDIKTYLADQQNLLVGFGMTRQEGAELSKQMTTLALDLASFANLDEASAVNNMTKAIMGESESAKALGAVLNDYTKEQAMLTLGIEGSYNSLDQLTKMQVNYQAILSQSPDAIGDCERSLDSYESTLKRFHSKLKELKTMIGQFFMPTFQKVINFGVKGLTVLRDIVQKISDFAEKVGGADRILTVLGATIAATFAILNFQKIVDGLKLVGKGLSSINLKVFAIAAAVLLVVLLIQDFIAFMNGENSLIGELFDRSGIGADKAREAILNAWTTVKEFLLGVWNTIKSVAESIFGALSDWWAENGEQIMDAFARIWGSIMTLCVAIWNALSLAAKTIFSALQAFWETWGGTIMTVFGIIFHTLVSLIQPFLNAVAGIIDFLANVFTGNWEGALQAICNIAAAVWQMVTIIFKGAWEAIFSVWNKLAEVFGGIFQSAWNVIRQKVSGIKETIISGFQAAIDWIRSLPSQAIQWGADIIDGMVSGIKGAIGKIGEAAKDVAGKITSFLHFSRPDEGPLAEYESWMPDFVDGLAQGIRKGIPVVQSAVKDLSGNMRVNAESDFSGAAALSGGAGPSIRLTAETEREPAENQIDSSRLGIPSWLPDLKQIVADGITWFRDVVFESIGRLAVTVKTAEPATENPDAKQSSALAGPLRTEKYLWIPETPQPAEMRFQNEELGREVWNKLLGNIEKLVNLVDFAGKEFSNTANMFSGIAGNILEAASRASTANPNTVAVVEGKSPVYNINQYVEISNQFNGDRAGQEKSSVAMDKAAGDATSEMARALKFARG